MTKLPIACNFDGAPDTPAQRMQEYIRLFAAALVAREPTPTGGRFRFRADPGIEGWVRDLAQREAACCPFFTSRVSVADGQVIWDLSTIDDDPARAALATFLALPEILAQGPDSVATRLRTAGLDIASEPMSR
jgi:hypothetical protein